MFIFPHIITKCQMLQKTMEFLLLATSVYFQIHHYARTWKTSDVLSMLQRILIYIENENFKRGGAAQSTWRYNVARH